MVYSLFLSLGMMVATAQPAATSIDIRADLPVDVSAERCESFEENNIIECIGSVRVSQDGAIFTADKMKIFGASSGDGFERIEGDGNVRYSNGVNAVSGNRAVYDGPNTTITVIGDVVVIQGDQIMVGGKLVYNTKSRAMLFTPGTDGRVRGVFNTAAAGQKTK